MRIWKLVLGLGLLLIASAAYGKQDNKYVGKFMKDMKGQELPELVSNDDDWINSDTALTLEGLKNKLVYIEFGFLA